MEKCWKRMQVPKGFTIFMMIILALIGTAGTITSFIFLMGSSIAGYITLYTFTSLITLVTLFVVIFWIIFMLKKIYAPVGSKTNYGERKPINTKFATFTYSNWFYVFAMTVYGLTAIITTIGGVVLLSLLGVDKLKPSALIPFGLILIVLGGVLTGLWGWFIAYQTRPMYRSKKHSLNKR